jgi:hypothetical protein
MRSSGPTVRSGDPVSEGDQRKVQLVPGSDRWVGERLRTVSRQLPHGDLAATQAAACGQIHPASSTAAARS